MANAYDDKGRELHCKYCGCTNFDTTAGVKGTGEASDQKGWYWCTSCNTWVPTLPKEN